MDLLLTPPKTLVPIEKTPYLGTDLSKWDGGPFLTYAVRSGSMRWIYPDVRQLFSELQSEEPCVDCFRPYPKSERDQFAQRWLFFGLAAEFLGLNEQEDGARTVEATLAELELTNLYEKSVIQDEDQHILTGKFILDSRPLIIERVLLLKSDASRRLRVKKLQRCLYMSWNLVNLWTSMNEDSKLVSVSVSYSISALIEALSMELFVACNFGRLPKVNDLGAVNDCTFKYFQSASTKKKMLTSGWCKSDIQKFQDLYSGLNTIHYLSCLKKDNLGRNHFGCTENMCKAAQIDNETYKTSHVVESCKCDDVELDRDKVKSMLTITTGFPVLRLDVSEGTNEVSITVEEYVKDVPYIALSHVWADGMGNPRQNALPRCQMTRLHSLITKVQKQVRRQKASDIPYRVWIDTLCCPVEQEEKNIALERIKDVYRNAEHVLVLDASLTSFTVTMENIPEGALRIFACSTWMRRLWTLQEGALAKSIYFQFSNIAFEGISILGCLTECVQRDARYMSLWMDIHREFTSINSFFNAPIFPGSDKILENEGQPLNATSDTLLRALRSRSVSVPSDEPLCISTLMSLDVGKILAAGTGVEDRMIEFWKLYADKYGGIPPRIVFCSDNSLKQQGWRWAPRTRLKTDGDSTLHIHGKGGTYLSFESNNSSTLSLGIQTARGLKAQFSGFLLRTKPWRSDLPLHTWEGLQSDPEIFLFARSNKSHKYYRISDEFRSAKLSSWSDEEKDEYDRNHRASICKAIDPGERALMRDPYVMLGSTCTYMLVEHIEAIQDKEPYIATQALEVHAIRRLILEELNDNQALVARTVQKLAQEIALGNTTTKLLALTDSTNSEFKAAVSKLQQCMNEAMSQAWDSDQNFANAIATRWGLDKDRAWTLISKCAPHDIVLYKLPDEQTWIVD